MKFVIENNQVICIENNSSKTLFADVLQHNQEELMLYSVFKRFRQGRSRNQKNIGDNCPMLYALKGLDGLTVSVENQMIFYQTAAQRIRDYFGHQMPFDYFVLLPSSHNISRRLAQQLTHDNQIPIVDNFIQKKTNGDIQSELNQFLDNHQLERNIHAILMKKLREFDKQDDFSVKHIPAKYRYWTEPFCLSSECIFRQPEKRILLIDDICSSGVSLFHAKSLIQRENPSVSISALTLFGKIQ